MRTGRSIDMIKLTVAFLLRTHAKRHSPNKVGTHCNVTPYRDSVDGTRDHVSDQKLVTRQHYALVRCAVGIWPSHQRDDKVKA